MPDSSTSLPNPSLGRRRFLAAGVGLGAGVLAARSASAVQRPAEGSPDVHLFYYPWYGSPAVHGSWRHWQQGGHQPPESVGADFYPLLGAYDAGDEEVVAQHMRWVRQAGVGVVATTWWGQGSYEDQRVPLLLDVAAEHGVAVAWHLEPYEERTALSTVDDIAYINERYGGHPAFYRDAAHGNRPAFYVFNSLLTQDWSELAAVGGENIVLAQTTDVSRVGDFQGVYTYAVLTEFEGWAGVAEWCRANGLIWAPSVGPGYIDDRAVPGNTTETIDRADGETYDAIWSAVLSPENGGSPDWVSITSFNEWHEGSTIEPASATPPPGHNYLTYDGAYGMTGAESATAYLERTRHWVDVFRNSSRGVGGSPVVR
ncbi:alpha-mannosidase [Streptomyces sp. 3MP-14]|uniref:Alpha-mannosidase n=1 Tax=Streptomyces mimosae TaxID=2586635 RepID=A0A5N5ZVE8_9ACTN|nr:MULTISPECIES: glycoside hydrolase family 99 protein [Streptomyces]KAB8160225.1 alpha-mannosidase [Streptomyces mimosae]KAB8173013.1 alpha-mannosidase [Streptomyces sp. 3MP-14]